MIVRCRKQDVQLVQVSIMLAVNAFKIAFVLQSECIYFLSIFLCLSATSLRYF